MPTLTSYPSYRDSGVTWLGDVPAHWQTKKLRQCGMTLGGMTPSMDERQFWDGDIPWITPKDMKKEAIRDSAIRVTEAALRNTSLRLICPSAVLMVVRGMILVRQVPIAWTTGPVTINQDMKALLPAQGLKTEFLARVLAAAQDALLSMIDVAGHGTRRLPTERWHTLAVPIPFEEEQEAVVRFLDHADRRIRRYIRAKEKMIALLEEQKLAIIHQTVTGQINVRTGQPYPAYKPSGVEWLGDVPAHWQIKKLSQCGMSVGGMTPSMEIRRYWNDEVPWVTPKDMKTEAIGDSGIKVSEVALRETSLKLIDPPAVLMVVRGMILARKVPISWTTCPVTINQDMKALIPNPGIDAEFLARLLASARDAFASLIDVAGHGTRRLPTERWRALALAIPPESEQTLIVRSLKRATTRVDEGIACVRSEVELLREYRTRLIADVVTGKLDVREAAAALPEVDPLAADDEANHPFDAGAAAAFEEDQALAEVAG